MPLILHALKRKLTWNQRRRSVLGWCYMGKWDFNWKHFHHDLLFRWEYYRTKRQEATKVDKLILWTVDACDSGAGKQVICCLFKYIMQRKTTWVIRLRRRDICNERKYWNEILLEFLTIIQLIGFMICITQIEYTKRERVYSLLGR